MSVRDGSDGPKASSDGDGDAGKEQHEALHSVACYARPKPWAAVVEADPAHAADAAVASKRGHGSAVAGVLPTACNWAALLRCGSVGTLDGLGFSAWRCRMVGRRKVDEKEEQEKKAEEDVEGGEVGVEPSL